MSGFLCSMVGASFTVAAVAQVLRAKKGITAVGNAQIDTAQSKFGGASALFDGTGDYLTVTATDFNWGTGDFTVEGWIRHSAVNDVQVYWDFRINSGTDGHILYLTNASKLEYYDGSTYTGTTSLSTNTWYHLAVSRSSGTLKIFINGTQEINVSNSNNHSYGLRMYIGISEDLLSTNSMNGHIDEIRVSNTARYTATFTPSTTAFVNDANTLLLIHANGTDASTFFEDDNGVRASRSLIAIGNAQIDTAQSKFGGSALLCDGTGDYVLSPAGSHFDFGTGDFTIEYFIRFNAINTLYVPIALRPTSGIGNGEWWCEVQAGDNKMYWGFKNQAGTTFYANFPVIGTAMTTGSFHHIALVKSGSTLTQYLNGTANGNVGTGLTGSFGISTTDLWVGAGAGAYSLNGWLDEVRISNSARYTTTFTPTTSAFVNDANTLLLIHADGTDASTVFRDDNGARAQQSIQVNGNAQTDTAISKFGGSSLLLDGTGDAIQCSDDAMRFNASANRTIEFWIYSDRNNAIETLIFQGVNTGGTMDYWQWFFNSANLVLNIPGSSPVDVTITRNTATWYHFAWVKQGNSNAVYWNGTSVATFTKTDSDWGLTDNNTLFIGYQQGGTTAFDGNIDEFRISSSARYTANFTPSTTPFQSDANTVLLLHMDGTDGSTVFFDDNGIAPYTP